MSSPPNWLHRLFMSCIPGSRPDLEGDFLELYEMESGSTSRWKANLRWTLHSLGLLRFKIIVPKESYMRNNKLMLLGLYLKIGRRNLVKNKLYSSINLMGLSVGLAACILITLFVRDELSFDQHFSERNDVFRIAGRYESGGESRTESAMTSYLLKPFLKSKFADVREITRVDFQGDVVTVGNKQYLEENIVKVDSNFFKVFQYQFLRGDTKALYDPSSVVISESIANKYFGSDDPIGQLLEVNDVNFNVSAVIEDQPQNAHFIAEIFLPMHGVMQWYPQWVTTNFSGYGMYTYFKMNEVTDPHSFEALLNQHITEEWGNPNPPEYFLQSLASIHLYSDLNHEIAPNGSITVVYVFSFTALIILLLACINYVNLSLASSFQRGKEVGMKKVLGASKQSQVLQFQLESLLIALFAGVLAIVLVMLVNPYFNSLTDKEIYFNIFKDPFILISLFSIVAFVGLLTGSFPAIFLLRIPALKGITGTLFHGGKQRFSVRNILVSLQFLISVTLIIATLAVVNQVNFLRTKDLGISPQHVLMIPLQSLAFSGQYEVMKQELLKDPSILSIGASNNKVTNRIGGWRGYRLNGEEDRTFCPTVVISYDFLKTMDAEIISGRDYDRDHASDELKAYLVNEAAVKFFGLENPVGTAISGAAFTGSSWATKEAKIVGVVKDFHFASLHSEVRPTVFSLHSNITSSLFWMVVRISPENTQKTLQTINNIWEQFSPDRPLYYEFMEDELKAHYEKEDTFLQVLTTFAGLSIFIGCLGLFGITAFIMKWRTKEIGIRKILGAKLNTLLVLLSRDFLKLILVANLLGGPIAYFFMKEWTENFAYRAPIAWWIFIVTCFGLLIVAGITVFYHTFRVAKSNPVKAIKYE